MELLARYFDKRYVVLGSHSAGRLLRRGHNERVQVVRGWMHSAGGLDVLDAGCGDGALLADVLRAPPRRLHIEDLVPRALSRAQVRLAHRCKSLTVRVGDIRSAAGDDTFDFVVVIGVFEYDEDWSGLLEALWRRTRGVLIADFPRNQIVHHWLRRQWLRLHGLSLRTTSREVLLGVVNRCDADATIVPTRLHWMVRLTRVRQ